MGNCKNFFYQKRRYYNFSLGIPIHESHKISNMELIWPMQGDKCIHCMPRGVKVIFFAYIEEVKEFITKRGYYNFTS